MSLGSVHFKKRQVGIKHKGEIMKNTLKHEDIEKILAEADDLLKQTDTEAG